MRLLAICVAMSDPALLLSPLAHSLIYPSPHQRYQSSSNLGFHGSNSDTNSRTFHNHQEPRASVQPIDRFIGAGPQGNSSWQGEW
jgi:hypothetical protein